LLEKVNLLRLAAKILAPGTWPEQSAVSPDARTRSAGTKEGASPEDVQRQEWSRIQNDEIAALHEQQVSAGSSHRPVAGPYPHGDHGTNMTVEWAVARERERCAALVEACASVQQGEIRDLLDRLAIAIQTGR
jgi:hypothetical protein